MAKKHVHASRTPHTAHSGMSGNGGRFVPMNGHPDMETSSESHSEPRRHRFQTGHSDGSGIERHKGHKFSQKEYESLHLGW